MRSISRPRYVMVVWAFLIVALAALPIAGAQDGFPLIVDAAAPLEIPADALPVYLYSTTDEARTTLRVMDAEGEVVLQRSVGGDHNVTLLTADTAASGPLTVRATDETWVAWVPEARLVRHLGPSLFIPCLGERSVAYLWGDGAPKELRWFRVQGDPGDAEGLDIHVFEVNPLDRILFGTVNVTYEAGFVAAGPDAFWVVARSTPAACDAGIELVLEANRVVDDKTAFQFGYALAAAAAVVFAFLLFGRPPAMRVGARAFFVGFLIVATGAMAGPLADDAVAQEADDEASLGSGAGDSGLPRWSSGPDPRDPDAEIADLYPPGMLSASTLPRRTDEWSLCVARSGPEPVGVLYEAWAADRFLGNRTLAAPEVPGVDCFAGPGGPTRDVIWFGAVAPGTQLHHEAAPGRVYAPSSPGSVPVFGAGGMVVLPALSLDANVSILLEPGWAATVIVWGPHATHVDVEGAGVHYDVVPRGTDGTDRVLIKVVGPVEADGSSAHVLWEDSAWYRASPTLGHIGVAVVTALFVILWSGRRPVR